MAVKKKVPMRKCVGCGEMKPKKELIRILRTEEEEFVIDTTGKKNGRGAYLCPQKACFEQAVKNRGLERSFKQAIQTKSGRASLVVVAEDASDNTKKKFRDMCKFYKVPMIVYGDKDTLGHAMGKQFRASLAILDEGFAKGILKELKSRT